VKEHQDFIKPLLEGKNIGLMSEAGCPGVADPGAVIVKLAHEKGIQVVPLVGPSSILLAMMASGMNGQSFTFHGYLPIEKGEKK
jgi:16S rRNA (cytidine1402-2'-O)-methyltransferase